MKRLAIVAALLAIGVVVPLSIGSSHREAPLTSIDPTGDDTDVYAFTAKDAPDALTIVGNWVPFEDPAGGPNFYKFDPRAHYYLNIDNTGDGRYDVRYRFTFRDKIENPNSFLYALPGVSSIDDPKLNVKQFYNVERLSYGYARSASASKKHKRAHKKSKARKHKSKRRHNRGRRVLRSVRTIARNVPVAPNNVGPKTIPNYTAVANQAITDLPNGGKVFAGQRDDPFFADLGMAFDGINLEGRAAQKKAVDDLAGYAVHSIVLQVPEGRVTKDGEEVDSPDAKNAVVGVWASTERSRVSVLASHDRDDDEGDGFVQVSRLGNPLVNEVIIPLGQKDRFNRESPARDAENFGQYVVKPELAAVLNLLFNVGAPENNRTDIVQAVLQGIPGLNAQTGKPVDTIKINLGTPTAANPKRLGVLDGDLQGYPNGRRLTDDVLDIDLQVVAGELAGNPNGLGDGVNENDKPFLSSFPYLAEPESGFNSRIKKDYPTP
jgi:uncharacterized protein DUF4331